MSCRDEYLHLLTDIDTNEIMTAKTYQVKAAYYALKQFMETEQYASLPGGGIDHVQEAKDYLQRVLGRDHVQLGVVTRLWVWVVMEIWPDRGNEIRLISLTETPAKRLKDYLEHRYEDSLEPKMRPVVSWEKVRMNHDFGLSSYRAENRLYGRNYSGRRRALDGD